MGAKPNPERVYESIRAFEGEILVNCPHCSKRAMVSVERDEKYPYRKPSKAKCVCNNCYKPINSKQWFGPIILTPDFRRCDYCGSRLQTSKKVNKVERTIKAFCSGCETKRIYSASYSLTYPSSKQATDPFFGLPLWLQAPIDNNIFWAFNHEHLSYLKDYVAAILRKPRLGVQSDLIWRLPQYVKDAKNRSQILKIISRLQLK